MKDELKIFSGNANLPLAQEVCRELKVPLGKAKIGRFSDGETRVRIGENVRGKDVFILQTIAPPANENLMELLVVIDALRRASARRITAVIPYYGYARQDRKVEPRVPITAKLVANLLTAAGTNRILTMELHAGQIQGFFDIPVDNLFSGTVLMEYFQKKKLNNLVVVAPDPGGVERARAVSKRMKAGLAIADKRRPASNKASVMHIIGEVKGKKAIIVDDLVDTAETLVKVSAALKRRGVKEIYAACTHGILSEGAIEKIEQSPLKELWITNTVPLRGKSKKLKVISIAGLLAEAIHNIHYETSLSSLFG